MLLQMLEFRKTEYVGNIQVRHMWREWMVISAPSPLFVDATWATENFQHFRFLNLDKLTRWASELQHLNYNDTQQIVITLQIADIVALCNKKWLYTVKSSWLENWNGVIPFKINKLIQNFYLFLMLKI